MSTNQEIGKDGTYTYIRCTDRQMPPEIYQLRETPWFYAGSEEEEHVLDIIIGSEMIKLAQSDVQALLPYLERFARTGKLVEEGVSI